MASNCSDVQDRCDNNKMNEEVNQEEVQRDDCKYEILKKSQVMEIVNKTIERLSHSLPIPSQSILILLNYFKWDEEKLLHNFYDGDREKLFQDANIPNTFTEEIVATNRQEEECLICCEYHQAAGMGSLGCEHKYCNDCWSKYLENQILDEGMGENITCAAYGCTFLIDTETCLGLLKNIRAKKIYKAMTLNSVVETNPSLRWCKGPNCRYVIRNVNLAPQEPIICKCGRTSCSSCGKDWHFPIQCNYLKKWLEKCQNDSRTSYWITTNARDCPKCKISIENNGGCNKMTCKIRNCRYQFCWICMGSWESHYSCVAFTESTDVSESENLRERSRKELEWFSFLYDGYMDHKKSLEWEQRLHARVSNKIKILIDKGVPWSEMQMQTEMETFTKAIDILRQCRTTLMNSYPFAYYLEVNDQCNTFSNNQRDLLNSTKMLSDYLKRKIRIENYDGIKRKVEDQQIYCEKSRRVLEAHILEGYEQGFWKYRDCEISSGVSKVKVAENSVNHLKICIVGFIILLLLVFYLYY